jgi:hypothetical protein
MEKLLFDFTHYSLLELNLDYSRLEQGCFLVVIHCNKRPPHLGLLVDGHFYSAKSQGKDLGIHVNSLLDLLLKKKIATLFIELRDYHGRGDIHEYFKDFPYELIGQQTCLTPIVDWLQVPSDLNNIGEFLRFLEHQKKIARLFVVNLPDNYYGIPFYTNEDIRQRIEYLKHVTRKEGTA